MKRNSKLTLLLTTLILLAACAGPKTVSAPVADPAYWPTNGWQITTPESQGMDSARLAQMLEQVSASQTNLHSVLVIRNGYIVTQAYLHPYTAETREHVQSVTKSVIGALVGVAVKEGKIKSVDETLLSNFPDRIIANPGREKESIRLKHLLSMSSGLDCQEFSGGSRMEQTSGWVQFMLDLRMNAVPGKTFGYCNGNAHLLSAILEKSTGMNAREYANQTLFAPLGIGAVADSDWGADQRASPLAVTACT